MRSLPATDPRAWRAATIDERPCWYHPLSERCLAALDETVQQLRRQPRATTQLRLSETPCAAWAEELQPVRTVLEAGRGFAVIEGIPCPRYTAAEMQVLYWLVGQMLGHPVTQNVQGTLLYDVRDTGQSVEQGARYSVTNADTGFHTDGSFDESVPDYVGLLCIQTARSGGENQLVSAYSLLGALLAEHPAVLDTLSEPFHIDRRGGVRPGEAPTSRFPIFQWVGDGLVCRYLRYWIEAGHQKAEQPLTAAQKQALDVLDRVLDEPALQIQLTLRPGDLFFINNRWLLHKRSAFEDHPQAEQRRHYVRLWLRR
jgi:alpha-ketoglutarate-dependent taurine dioxygenase